MTKAKEDLGGAQALDSPSRRHRPPTALVRSYTGACCPGAYRQAGPLSKQRKRPPGRRFGCRPRPAVNFAPSLPLLPASPSPASTRHSRAASRRSSHGSGPALATSARTRRISNPNDTCALAAASRKPANTSSSTAPSPLCLTVRHPPLLPPTQKHHPRLPPQRPARDEGNAPVPRRLGPL